MPELPVPLSSVALRLAGEVGQTALDQIRLAGVTLAAELDQHIAAIRAELTAEPQPTVATAQLAGLAAGRSRSGRRHAAGDGRRGHPAARRPGPGRDPRVPWPGPVPVSCPDVPFTGTAAHPEAVLPLRLLLHYGCGFIEAAVNSDWWPAKSSATDWESMRLAALCDQISKAEAAAELHPDLRATA